MPVEMEKWQCIHVCTEFIQSLRTLALLHVFETRRALATCFLSVAAFGITDYLQYKLVLMCLPVRELLDLAAFLD